MSARNVAPADGGGRASGRERRQLRREERRAGEAGSGGTRPHDGRAGTERALASSRGRNVVHARIVDEESGRPIRGAHYEVVGPQGQVVARGVTETYGEVHHAVDGLGTYTIRVVEVPPTSAPDPHGAPPGEAPDGVAASEHTSARDAEDARLGPAPAPGSERDPSLPASEHGRAPEDDGARVGAAATGGERAGSSGDRERSDGGRA